MITNGNFFLPSFNILLSKVIDFFVQSSGRSTNMQLVRSHVFLYNCGMTLSNICIGSMTFLWTMPGVNSIQELFGGWGAVFPRMIRLHSVIQWCSFLTQVRQFGQFLNSSAQNQDENKAILKVLLVSYVCNDKQNMFAKLTQVEPLHSCFGPVDP